MKRKSNFLNVCMRQYAYTFGLSKRVLQTLLLMIIFVPSLLAADVSSPQSSAITGVVTDKVTGETIIGATVLIKGTTIGVSTDFDGAFSIKAKKSDVLAISYIGYVTQEITIESNKALKIQLSEDIEALEEVVVVGFGTQKKVNVTGSVAMVDAKILEARPVMNVSQALQGVVPGLNFSVNSQGGNLNNTMNINIRGSGSIGEGSKSAPLILIDGMEGNMNSINPNDILNIAVLKDAASAAIYGSRAAFGVILITTKSGKAGRTVINYSTNIRFTDGLQVPEMLDSYRFAQYFNRASINSGGRAEFSDEVMARILAYQNGEMTDGTVATPDGKYWNSYMGANANTDWFAEMYKDWVPSHEHNMSISGGTEKVTFLVSGNFMDQNGLIRHGGDNFKRYTLNARINAKLTDYVSLNYSSKWIREEFDKPTYLSDLFFHNIARRWPTNPVLDPNGYYSNGNEIVELRDGGRHKEQKDQTYNQVQVVIEPIKDWKIYVEGNMNIMNKFQHADALPIYAYYVSGEAYETSGGVNVGSVSEDAWRENFLTTNLYTDYFKQLESGHYFKGMVGFNAELMQTRYLYGSKRGLISTDVPTVGTGTIDARSGGGYAHWSTAGFFGRLNYNYKERYMLEVNARYDGTSRFIGDKRWGVFPSFSAGWNIAREDFFMNSPLANHVNMFKFRGSWGQLGNMNTEAWYPFYQSMPIGNESGGWIVDDKRPNTASAPGIVSSLMTWETVESWNVGLDFGALNNRLTGAFDYFKRYTKNMIGPAPELPSILGTGVPKVNNSDQESFGFELEIGWRDQIGNFSYGVKAVLSDDQQRITRYPNDLYDLGQPYAGKLQGNVWGYETIGIAKTDAEMNAHLATLPNGGQDALGSNWQAGDIMYKDLNGDGKINLGSSTLDDPGDRKIIGNSSARYKYGITLDAAWKGIDVSAFFQGVAKSDVPIGGPYFWGATGGLWQSAGFTEHWDFFRPEGDPLGENLDAYYARPLFSTGKNQQVQSRYIQDASYLRLKNIQIGYTFPSEMMSKIKIQSLRVYVSGDNLMTLTSLSPIFDPETIAGGWGEGKVYPLSRTISAGLSINF